MDDDIAGRTDRAPGENGTTTRSRENTRHRRRREVADDCFYALNNKTFTQDLQAAFDEIQLQAFDCSFNLPQPQGGAPDLSKINVQLETQQGTQQVMRDTAHQDGWDYLPNQKHLQLYGNACTMLKADAKNQVDIVVGCTTQGH